MSKSTFEEVDDELYTTLETVKEEALWEWLIRPPEHGDNFLFSFLRGVEGSCSVIPVEDSVEKYFIDGSTIKKYVFALQILLQVSNVDDNTNTNNLRLTRTWQLWIKEQAAKGNFPDFGDRCSDYRLVVTHAPQVSNQYENDLARYDFYSTLYYKEEL